MKRFIAFIGIIAGFSLVARADHITGGEMFYSYAGFSNGSHHYSVTLKLFMRCNSGRQFINPAIVSIFDKSTNARVTDMSVALASQQTISLTNAGPCITNPPTVCYEVGYYQFSVSLPSSAGGYVLASQVNYRIAGINNLTPGYGLIGALYSAEIPGNSAVPNGYENNSAHFTGNDLVVVCSDNSFSYSFGAEDSDGDQLRYSFCDAYVSGGGSGPGGTPTPPPPFEPVPYGFPAFSGLAPLGNNVHINTSTGLISGIAPSSGIYVVTVCVEEIRNAVVIATQRKDLQINITSCSIAAASLFPEYMLCHNTKTITLSNLSISPLINSYFWEFTNNAGAVIFTSTIATVTYTFADTGTYRIKLVVNRGQQCSDSTTSLARVYPGFIPDFSSTGICISKPTIFVDKTTTVYGIINSWNWDFGESTTPNDISDIQNPVYIYPTTGAKNILLTVTNSKGCRDTITKNIVITDKPPIGLLFRDMLKCIPDAVQLQASGSGNFSWTPLVQIINPNGPHPTVSPAITTTHYVDLDDNGCLNRDSVKVRVTDHVNLQAMNDTTVCGGDTIRLRVTSDGFRYSWTPASQLMDPAAANPFAITHSPTLYRVTAFIGSCSATDELMVTAVPYPFANAGTDTIICFNTFASLNGKTDGRSWRWSPPASLNNPILLSPVARPAKTTAYTLYAYDTRGCPKPGMDNVIVTVLPKIAAFAGRDTSVVIGQSLQLEASGGTRYNWIPSLALSSSDIFNPVAVYPDASRGIKYKVLIYNEAGCVDSAYITVKVFKTPPTVFVPNAFTPNGDGRNDQLKPIVVGMQKIEFFNVYNRWGQLIFTTGFTGYGWDGKVGGRLQESGSFVWMIKAIDYNGKPYFQKGTVTLIR